MVERQEIRVLHVIDAFNGGGGEHFLERLYLEGRNSAFSETICTIREPAYFERMRGEKVVSLSQMKGPSNGNNNDATWVVKTRAALLGLRLLLLLPRLVRLIRRDNYHVVMAIGFPASLLTAIASLFVRECKLVYRVPYERSPFVYPIERQVMTWVFGRFHAIVSISCFVEKSLLTVFPNVAPKCSVIYNGVGITPSSFPKQLDVRDGVVNFLSIGRLVPVKDHELLIRAFRMVVNANPACHLYIAGDGPLRPVLAQLIQELGLDGNVDLLGYVEKPFDSIIGVDVYVHSARSEGLCNAVLEALSFGLPVVATNAGPLCEIIEPGKHGLLVETDDVEGLATAMVRISADEQDRFSMGKNARMRSQAFSLERMRNEYENVFRAVVEGRKPSSTNAS